MHERPDPDELLQRLRSDEEKRAQGKLKIFLGASAGVGKTYAMLSEAHEQKDRDVDVVVGYVETHGRKETDRLLEGLELLPQHPVEYRGVTLQEFDIDAALVRKPRLILIDEFAHTNAPGSRHPKRYQDVLELLKAGIDVCTTVNIQHLESLNDVVAQITGVAIRETVPDAVFDRADEVELVDIPPKELQQRLREGKVYIPERVEKALDGFFREGNLIALRELALRRTADRVDAQMQSYRSQQNVSGVWAAKDRILVCIAPNKLGTRVARSAARIGAASHAEMIAVYVESDRQSDRSADEQRNAQEALRLAERLGMETVSGVGHDIVGEILRIAHQRNANLIVVGKPVKPRWREVLQGSVVDELVRRSGTIDVHVITGEAEERRSTWSPGKTESVNWQGYAATVLITAIATGICFVLKPHVDTTNLIMVFLLSVATVSSRFGVGESIFASLLGVATFDFFFVPPYLTFSVADTQYVLTFAIMLVVGLMISGLTLRLRRQALLWQWREHRTAMLYRLSRNLAKSRSTREIANIAAAEVAEVFQCDVAIFVVREDGILESTARSQSRFEEDPTEEAVANWVKEKAEPAGRGTDTLPNAAGIYIPLVGSRGVVGVLGLKTDEPVDAQQESVIETFANGLALALERTILAKESHVARLAAESEKMRNVLLNSVSHDLRTPLTAIAGAASTLKAGKGESKELAETIVDQAERLNRHVQNLLDMTRLESATVKPQFEWHAVEELVGSSIQQSQPMTVGHEIKTFIPPGMALVKVDGLLVEKALVNLLENAGRHSPRGTEIEIRVSRPQDKLRFQIADRGPGIPKGDEERIFDKFYRPEGQGDTGFGLGLAICRSVAQLHGGRVWAEHRPGGGARFYLELMTSGVAPEVPFE